MIEAVVPSIPDGWRATGHLPPFDIRHAHDQDIALLGWFTADLLQVWDPLGMYVIDIGWYPEGSLEGTYWCRLVRGQEWQEPFMEARVATLAGVRMWLDETIKLVQLKIAQ